MKDLVLVARNVSPHQRWSRRGCRLSKKVSGVRDSDSNEIAHMLALHNNNKPVYLIFESTNGLENARHQMKDKLKGFWTNQDAQMEDHKENKHQAEPISYGLGILSNKHSPSPPPTPRHDHHQPSPQFYPVKESVHLIPLPNSQWPLPRASIAPFWIVCGVLLGT